MGISRKLKGGIVAWASTVFGSLSAYIFTLETWGEWSTLPVAGGSAGLIGVGLASLAVHLRGDSDSIELEVAHLPAVGDFPDVDLSAAK